MTTYAYKAQTGTFNCAIAELLIAGFFKQSKDLWEFPSQ